MNSVNHFLFAFNICYVLFHNKVNISTIALFSFAFGVLIDFDMLYGKAKKLPTELYHTWIQKPFGFFVLGIPLGAYFSMTNNSIYFFLVTIPYASHIILDILTQHYYQFLLPFSKKVYKIGYFRPYPQFKSAQPFKQGPSEVYFFVPNLLAAVLFFKVF